MSYTMHEGTHYGDGISVCDRPCISGECTTSSTSEDQNQALGLTLTRQVVFIIPSPPPHTGGCILSVCMSLCMYVCMYINLVDLHFCV